MRLIRFACPVAVFRTRQWRQSDFVSPGWTTEITAFHVTSPQPKRRLMLTGSLSLFLAVCSLLSHCRYNHTFVILNPCSPSTCTLHIALRKCIPPPTSTQTKLYVYGSLHKHKIYCATMLSNLIYSWAWYFMRHSVLQVSPKSLHHCGASHDKPRLTTQMVMPKGQQDPIRLNDDPKLCLIHTIPQDAQPPLCCLTSWACR